MLTKSTLIHLRFPFSYFLLPIFLIALLFVQDLDGVKAFIAFVVLHLLVYPSSNGYNTWFDRDKGSIGGIKTPPEVASDLPKAALVMDSIGILLSLAVGWQFAVGIAVYIAFSRLYSHKSTRLKRFPLFSWFLAGFGQGGCVFLLLVFSLGKSGFDLFVPFSTLAGAILVTMFLMASYPMTQIYQHREDASRGDGTISLLLGVRGTFLFTGSFFGLVMGGFVLFFLLNGQTLSAILFLLLQLPNLLYFLMWMKRAWKVESAADFDSAMRLNFLSSTMINLFCIVSLFRETFFL